MRNYFVYLFIFLFTGYSMGQGNLSGDAFISLNGQVNPTRDLMSKSYLSQKYDSLSGVYGFNTIGISSRIPLYRKMDPISSGEYPKTIIITLTPFFSYQSLKLSWLENRQNIFRVGFGLNGLYHNGKKDMFIVSSNSFIANDDYTIYKPTLRYAGLFLYDRKSNENFSYQLGLSFLYNFGRGLVLPTFGVKFKTDPKGTLNINFPLGVYYRHRSSDKYTYRVALKPVGNVASLTNQFGEFNNAADVVILRHREGAVSYSGRYTKNNHWIYAFETALTVNRRLYVSESSTGSLLNFAEAEIKPNVFLNASVIYRFYKPSKKTLKLTEDEIDDLVY